MDDIELLKKAIRDLHGCDSTHAASIAVHKKFEGRTLWQGVVEVFSLTAHPKASIAYAWSYKNDSGKWHHIAVLEIPPINSACDAVRAYVVAQRSA